MADDLLVTVSRARADGTVAQIALTADPAVVAATLAALERVLRGPERRVLELARDPAPPPTMPADPGDRS